MKLVLNVMFLLSVVAVLALLPGGAVALALARDWTWWATIPAVAVAMLLALPLTMLYMMLIGCLVNRAAFRRGFQGDCGDDCAAAHR